MSNVIAFPTSFTASMHAVARELGKISPALGLAWDEWLFGVQGRDVVASFEDLDPPYFRLAVPDGICPDDAMRRFIVAAEREYHRVRSREVA